MGFKLGSTIYVDVTTHNPATGAVADASAITSEVFENDTDTAILSPTPTKRTSKTGDYRISLACTAANGFEAGKSYNVVVSATVGGVSAKAVAATFVLEAYDLTDIRHLVSTVVLAVIDPSTAAAGGSPLELYQGNTRTFTFVCTNASLTPYNLTGASAVFTVKEEKADTTAVVTKTTDSGISLSDPTNGELQVSFAHTDTHELADTVLDRPLAYDLRVTLAGGDVLTVAESVLTIKRPVTAP